MQTFDSFVTLLPVPELGSLYCLTIDPAAVAATIHSAGVESTIVGAEDEWRQIIITPGDLPIHDSKLTLSLKLKQIDQLFFRKTITELLTHLSQIPAGNVYRQHQLESLVPHFSACIEMVAEPSFSKHEEYLDVLTRIARLTDGVFVIPAGFLDCESRELLMMDGSSNPKARMPAIPEYPAPVQTSFNSQDPGPAVDDAFEQEFDKEFDPPLAKRVAERMYVLLSVAYRGILDVREDRPNRESYLARLGDWFWTLQVGHELEDYERHILDQPLGGISPEEAAQISHQLECVAVMAWSLGLTDLPAHDRSVQGKSLGDLLGLFREDTRYVIDSADLRSELDLRAQADRIMAIHWRLREYEINPQPVDFVGMCRDNWFGPIAINELPTVDNDLSIGGKPITQSDPAIRLKTLTAIAQRHRAINWVCGHHPTFSKVDIST